MSNRRDRDFLADILEAVQRATRYVDRMNYHTFTDDTKTQDAVIRTIEIIGEATKNLSQELRTGNPEVPWKNMAAMRDKLIHHYFGINLDIVWEITIEELPKIEEKIINILKKLN